MHPHSRFKSPNDDDNGDKSSMPNSQEPRHSHGRGHDYDGFVENSTNMNFNTYISRSNYYRPTFHQYGKASQSNHADQHSDLPSYGNDRSYARSYDYQHHRNDSRRYESKRGYCTSDQNRGDSYRSSRHKHSSKHPRERNFRSLSPKRQKTSHCYDPPSENNRQNVHHETKPLSRPMPNSRHYVQPTEDVLRHTKFPPTAISIPSNDIKNTVIKSVAASHTSNTVINMSADVKPSPTSNRNLPILTSTPANNEVSPSHTRKKKKGKGR